MKRRPALRLQLDGELVVDNFAGGGGASLGIEMALSRSPDIAINHDAEAIAMHKANHPKTRHYCESVWNVDPDEICDGKRVRLMWLSPDCKHFSKAKGGKPVEKTIRGLAWIAIRWAKAKARPRWIILENVEEFADWGPLLANQKPDPRRRGLTYRRWVRDLEACGYNVESRELRACDYGAPTSRKRLFVIANCDGNAITWPEPTHGPGLLPYRTAAECIDWSLPGKSIFGRKKPLATNTERRIARGIRKYVIEAEKPFIVPLTHAGDARVHDIDDPLRTVTGAHRGEYAVVDVELRNGSGDKYDKIDFLTESDRRFFRGAEILAERTEIERKAGVLARLGQTGGNGGYANAIDDPLTTVTSKAEHLLVAPTLIQAGYGERPGQAPRVPGLHVPLGTIVAQGRKHALVSALLAKHYGGPAVLKKQGPGRPMAAPFDTVTAKDHHSLVTAHLLKMRGGFTDHQVTAASLEEPAPTVTASGNHYYEVRAFLVKYYGDLRQDPALDKPMHTITAKHRFAIVTVYGVDYLIVDICMRMLNPRELFRAQSFPDGYKIDIMIPIVRRGVVTGMKRLSKSAQVRMCGNSVCPVLAKAIIEATVVASMATKRKAVRRAG